MIEVGAFEAKNTFGSLLDRVEHGEEIVITRHGRPVARLVPNAGKRDVAAAKAALQRIRERAKGGGGFDWEEMKALRDTGRVLIRQEGDNIVLSPRPASWSSYLDRGPKASADFMENVEDLPVQERE